MCAHIAHAEGNGMIIEFKPSSKARKRAPQHEKRPSRDVVASTIDHATVRAHDLARVAYDAYSVTHHSVSGVPWDMLDDADQAPWVAALRAITAQQERYAIEATQSGVSFVWDKPFLARTYVGLPKGQREERDTLVSFCWALWPDKDDPTLAGEVERDGLRFTPMVSRHGGAFTDALDMRGCTVHGHLHELYDLAASCSSLVTAKRMVETYVREVGIWG